MHQYLEYIIKSGFIVSIVFNDQEKCTFFPTVNINLGHYMYLLSVCFNNEQKQNVVTLQI